MIKNEQKEKSRYINMLLYGSAGWKEKKILVDLA